jgi:peptidoglycan/xylan/chitin deacetylase (PgdA/CDA1 family)
MDFDGPSVEVGRKLLPLGVHSHGRYSAKCGLPRYVAMFERLAVPATFFVPGYDAEVHPVTVRDVARAGFEIGTHGYLHEGWDLGDGEPALLEKTHRIVGDIIGKAPVGWRSPSGRKSTTTIHTLRRLGYRYDSSDKDADLPYLPVVDGVGLRDFVSLPNNTSSLDDFPFYRVSYTPASEVLRHWEQEFDAVWQEGGYYNLTLHPRTGYGSGSPARARIVEQIIAHARSRAGVRFVTLGELAEWCLAQPQRWQLEPAA